MLLLWLSIVCMVPFDLCRFDAEIADPSKMIMNRVLNICMPFLFLSDKCQDAAAYLLAKFMSRRDVSIAKLSEFHAELLSLVTESKSKNINHSLP